MQIPLTITVDGFTPVTCSNDIDCLNRSSIIIAQHKLGMVSRELDGRRLNTARCGRGMVALWQLPHELTERSAQRPVPVKKNLMPSFTRYSGEPAVGSAADDTSWSRACVARSMIDSERSAQFAT